jgi:hypothetical protein
MAKFRLEGGYSSERIRSLQSIIYVINLGFAVLCTVQKKELTSCQCERKGWPASPLPSDKSSEPIKNKVLISNVDPKIFLSDPGVRNSELRIRIQEFN